MGIARGAARLLLAEAAVRPFTGSVLQLGRQDIFFGSEDLRRWAEEQGVPLSIGEELRPNKRGAEMGDIDDVSFFRLLGFQSVLSTDCSNYERPDYVLDMNVPVPEELHGKFDVIFDGGTMEHCFNIFQVLQNIFAMLKIGGRIIHESPSSNHVDHGFYMFSPSLFWDYYQANMWQVNTSNLCEYTFRHDIDLWSIYEYLPGCLDHLSFGGFTNGKMLGVWFIAEKTIRSSGNCVPQQGRYVRAWARHSDKQSTPSDVGAQSLSIYERLRNMLSKSPPIFIVARFLATPYLRYRNRLSLKMPRMIARY